MLAGHVLRPVPHVAHNAPDVAKYAYWLDTFCLESEYDYDPVWATCVELKVPPTFHSPAMGWGSRTTSNYMYNHMGHYAAAGEAVCKALFMGGVTRRFPTLQCGFLESGVGWAAQTPAVRSNKAGARNRRERDMAASGEGIVSGAPRAVRPRSGTRRARSTGPVGRAYDFAGGFLIRAGELGDAEIEVHPGDDRIAVELGALGDRQGLVEQPARGVVVHRVVARHRGPGLGGDVGPRLGVRDRSEAHHAQDHTEDRHGTAAGTHPSFYTRGRRGRAKLSA